MGQEDEGQPGDPVWSVLSITPVGPLDLGCGDASWPSRACARQGTPDALGPFSSGGGKRGVSLPLCHPTHCLLLRRDPGTQIVFWALSWATLQCPAGVFVGVHVGEGVGPRLSHHCVHHAFSELSPLPSFYPRPYSPLLPSPHSRHVHYLPDEEPAHDPHRWVTHQYVTTHPCHWGSPGAGPLP